MDEAAVTAQALAKPTVDLTFWDLFLQAHAVVQLVMVGLLLASVWCWAIIVDKGLQFARARRSMDRFEHNFWSSGSLEELYNTVASRPAGMLGSIFIAAMREWKRSHESARPAIASLRQRIDRVMDVTISREAQALQQGLGVLATVGASAPFIGLFGTVWGIMTAFQAIAASENTSLAVVAPGIAEALFATAIGLVAAIPAVIAYNKLSGDAGKLTARMEGFADEFSAILSRQIDERT